MGQQGRDHTDVWGAHAAHKLPWMAASQQGRDHTDVWGAHVAHKLPWMAASHFRKDAFSAPWCTLNPCSCSVAAHVSSACMHCPSLLELTWGMGALRARAACWCARSFVAALHAGDAHYA